MLEQQKSAEERACQGYQDFTNWKQCVLCQCDADKENLVRRPKTDSYQHLLDAVEERARVCVMAYGINCRPLHKLSPATGDNLFREILSPATIYLGKY